MTCIVLKSCIELKGTHSVAGVVSLRISRTFSHCYNIGTSTLSWGICWWSGWEGTGYRCNCFLNIRHMRHDWDVWAPCKGLNRSGRITNIASSGHFVCTMFMQCSWYSISGRRCGLYFVFLNSLLFPLPQALNLRVFLYFFLPL